MDPFRNYDAWLEAPIQRMYADADRFVDWCEANDFDPDDPDAEREYEAHCEAEAEAEYEARMERPEPEDWEP